MKTDFILPVLSEKSYQLSLDKNCYLFDISSNLNKIEVKKNIIKTYNVEVKSVNILRLKGKKKRVISLKGRTNNQSGFKSDKKRAYVYLKDGFKIPIFDAIEEENKKEAKAQENFDKLAKKELEKEDKKPITRRLLSSRKKKAEE